MANNHCVMVLYATTTLPRGSIDDSGNDVLQRSKLTQQLATARSLICALYGLNMYSSSIIAGSCVSTGEYVYVCPVIVHFVRLQQRRLEDNLLQYLRSYQELVC